MTEEEFINTVIPLLEKDFFIKEEVSGIHLSGQKVRIDRVIMPKDPTDWANGRKTAFGLEFKKPKYESFKDISKLFKQCVDYHYTRFGENEIYLPIIICPTPFNEEDKTQYWIEKILGRFHIGFLKFIDYQDGQDLQIVFSETHTIWSYRDGVREGNRWKFKRKFGSQ